jgi:hypothetical protein
MRLNSDIKSITADIHHWVRKQPMGKIFFAKDIPVEGSEAAIRKAISKLVKEQEIIRLSNGIYLFPKRDPLLGILKPSLEEIALAIADRDNAQIQPSGGLALNKLGLSTQVPMKQVYYTNGSARNVTIGKGIITFIKKSPKRVAQKNYISALVIAALEELGADQIDFEVKKKLRDLILNEETQKAIREDISTAPAWIRNIIKDLLQPIHNTK